MAEIRSTLELVMERTRHLHMTAEEKRKQAAEALKEAVSRLARKYLAGQISLGEFQTRLNHLQGEGASGKAAAAAEIGALIDPASANTPLLDLLKEGLGFDVSGIEATLHSFRRKLDSEERREVERIRGDLLKQGISGSAVTPNLEADKDWARRRTEMFETARAELAPLIARLNNLNS